MKRVHSSAVLALLLFQFCTLKQSLAAAVSTSSPEATQVAMAILKSGGNAIDAACGAVFALNVTQPHFSGIGGGGFALIHRKDKGNLFLDFREAAPASVTAQLFINPESKTTPDWLERNTGSKAVGIPGVVAGCGLAVKENGKLPWKKVIEPSIQLARAGFMISQFFQEELADQWKRISPFDFTKALLQGASENGLQKGEVFKQPILAQTLEALSNEGPESFYSGKLAHQWVSEARALGVPITQKDLEDYRVHKRDLIDFNFGKFHGITISAPSSAGLTVSAVLRYLDHYYQTHPIGKMRLLERYVVALEVKAIYAKIRNENVADPVRMKMSTADLVHKSTEAEVWQQLDEKIRAKLMTVVRQKGRKPTERSFGSLKKQKTHTAHVSVVDDFGNAIALTSSVGGIFGSGIILPKSGFVLNSTLGDFNPSPDQLNSPAPQMRPLSNMSPVLIFEGKPSRQKLVGVMGAAGGYLIPSGIVDFVTNYYFYNLNGDQSIRSPRVHSEDGSEVSIEKHISSETTEQLSQLGYTVDPVENVWSVFEGVVRKSPQETWEAVAETRYDGLGLSE